MPGMLDNVKVEAYGTSMALSSIATISVRGAQLLVVSLHDQSISSEVETAIRECGLSLNPQAQGLTLPCLPLNPALLCVARLQVQANKTINIAIPKMTKEVRQQVIKLAAKQAEDARQACHPSPRVRVRVRVRGLGDW